MADKKTPAVKAKRHWTGGRKKLEDKKVPVSIYPLESRLKALTRGTIQQISIEAIERAYKKTL